MKIVVTGGIGSGKSTVCQLLADALPNHHVFSIDEFVRDAYDNPEICSALRLEFGTSDRLKIRDIVFADKQAMKELEFIFHDIISRKIETLMQRNDFILEFPLLVENAPTLISRFDFVISVVSPPSLQIQRVSDRDGRSQDQILAIMESQTTDEHRFAVSDAIIYNGIRAIHEENYLQLEIKKALDLMRKKQLKGKKIGIVSGSFDPITLGHTWVIQRALDIVDYIIVAVASNPSKKYLFDDETRSQLVKCTLQEVLSPEQMARVTIDFIPSDELIVSYAANSGAKFIFRGLRGATDLEYENQLNLLQKKIAPEIETIFLMTPRELIEISSSLIKGALALREWERVAAPYVSKCVLEKLKDVHK